MLSVTFEDYVIEFNERGNPDGMCIDKNGMLWIAEWGGSCISQWNPETGKKIKDIKLPHKNVTSCCLDNNTNLYVTTAKDESDGIGNGSGLFHFNLNKK